MFAHAGIVRLHRGQYDRGVTIEISRGSRYATTLTKLPAHAPNTKANSAPSPRGISINESPLPSPFPPAVPPRPQAYVRAADGSITNLNATGDYLLGGAAA